MLNMFNRWGGFYDDWGSAHRTTRPNPFVVRLSGTHQRLGTVTASASSGWSLFLNSSGPLNLKPFPALDLAQSPDPADEPVDRDMPQTWSVGRLEGVVVVSNQVNGP